ncbi:MBL fold metallo-hydrolase [Ornithinibacillus sp. BX22]|uniref:MBL fold metallo-hydrolase n=1 Tax=Ornithinibacillus hominis TaxID=2763055 RepID=A0A923L532_9BACI|nr:MBL fold metallo-hydrolase [Ornithinibacillus hominis]MBC5636648.1 MBL fold metallo-hydrolase [Ornithinibacillus hominis]
MKLTVIGYWGGFPAPVSATSSYLLEKDGFSLLIDVGSGALSRLQQFKHVLDIDAVILSHYHHDHVADIGVLQYAWLVQSYVVGNKDILPIYAHTEDREGFNKLTHEYTEAIAYNPSETLTVGPFQIDFLKTKHPVPCYGMRITDGEKVLVYTADTSFQEEWISFSRDADVLITDCNFYEDQDGSQAGHMTSIEGATIAREANVKELILSHLPQYGNRQELVEQASKVFAGSIQLAEEGLTWGK